MSGVFSPSEQALVERAVVAIERFADALEVIAGVVDDVYQEEAKRKAPPPPPRVLRPTPTRR